MMTKSINAQGVVEEKLHEPMGGWLAIVVVVVVIIVATAFSGGSEEMSRR